MHDFFTPGKLRFVMRHAKLGIGITVFGFASLFLLIGIHEIEFKQVSIPEYGWSAILSIPVTIICMGGFSVIYEYYIRNEFSKSMRSQYWAWATGVTVLPSHSNAPDRKEVLKLAEESVRIMSTTFSQYFNDVKDRVDKKAKSGVQFKFVIYNPESAAIEEKGREEGFPPEFFMHEIESVCTRYLGPLRKKYPENIKVKFCDFNTPFGITIIDDRQMVLSLNIYGLARSKNETPCLIIENKYDRESVFKLYEESFDAIWRKLSDDIPGCLLPYFEDMGDIEAQPGA